MITDPADGQPGSLAFVAHEVRASAAAGTMSDAEVDQALTMVAAALDLDRGESGVRDALVAMVAGRPIRSLVGYVRAVAAGGDLGRFLPAGAGRRRGPATADELRAEIARLRAGPACEHGEPGGPALHPTAGTPLCPQCRAGRGLPSGVNGQALPGSAEPPTVDNRPVSDPSGTSA